MINYLLRNSFNSITLYQLSSKLFHSCDGLISFTDSLKHRNVTTYFSNEASSPIRFEQMSFPDLVWSTILQDDISLYTYPLGDIIERSIKQTVVSLFLNSPLLNSTSVETHLDNENFIQEVYRLSDSVDLSILLKEFLSNFFFSQCISTLRAKAGSSTDLGYAYQYKNGYLVSLDDQITLRKSLLDKCKEIAISLAPYFLSSLKKRSSNSKIRVISEGLENVLPFVIWHQENHSSHESKPYVNIIVGKTSRTKLAPQYGIDTELQRIILNGNHKNVTFQLSDIESFVGHPLHSLTKDLLEIAFVIYISDLYVKRNSDYSRRLNIYIPVRHPDIWSRVSSKLEKTISFLARDSVTLIFSIKNEHRDNITSFNVSEDNKCCCLFSGGIDSAVGILWALNKGFSPSLISYASGNLSGTQSNLLNQINQVTSSNLPHLKVSWQASRRKRGSYRLGYHQDSMLYQHLRSFFYLSLAYAVALESGYNTVFVFENGPIVVNPLLSESHINTRTVHPRFLEYFRSTMDSVFESNIRIINPYIYKTKSQLASYIQNKRLAAEIIPYTSSCYYYWGIKTVARLLDDYDYQGSHDKECYTAAIIGKSQA